MMILLGHEYFHTSARFRLSTGELNQKTAKWQTRLGSQRLCIALEEFKDFFSLETLVYFLRKIKTNGPSLPLPSEDVFTLEGQASLSLSLQRGEGADTQATLYKL